MESIVVDNISKRYRIPHHKKTTLFQNLVGLIKQQSNYEELWALKDVSFEVERGQAFGIIGRNGSGKSTLLKMLARVLYPDSGSVIINGKIASFLELGVGFQPELSARENVYIYSSILGVNRKETQRIYEDILEFAELKKFEDMKLKNFSSGMLMRLAFSTAVHTDPDIMLIDEVLAVGDELFQKKCMEKIHEFKQQDKTIIFVSHALDVVNQVCETAMLIDGGHVIYIGHTDEVIRNYLYMLDHQRSMPSAASIADGTRFIDSFQSNGNLAFPESTKSEKIIGAGVDADADALCAAYYFVLSRFSPDKSGAVNQIRIRCSSPGNVKLAFYMDYNGEPGMLLNAVHTSIAVDTGWNNISFPLTLVSVDQYYWLAFCSDADIVNAKTTSNFTRRFKQATFHTFTFPNPAGSGFTTDTSHYDLITGWG